MVGSGWARHTRRGTTMQTRQTTDEALRVIGHAVDLVAEFTGKVDADFRAGRAALEEGVHHFLATLRNT